VCLTKHGTCAPRRGRAARTGLAPCTVPCQEEMRSRDRGRGHPTRRARLVAAWPTVMPPPPGHTGAPPRPSDERACGRRSAGSLIAAPTPSSHTSRRGRARGGLGREESLVCLSPSCAAATARSLKQTKTKLWWVGPELRIRPAILSALESMDRTVLIQPQTYHRGPDQWLRQRVLCTCHGSCLLLTRETHACHATRRACTRHLPTCAKSPSLSSRRNAMHNRWRLLIRAVIDCLFIRSGCVRGDDQMLKKKKLHDIP
jgi:hypothetical protein